MTGQNMRRKSEVWSRHGKHAKVDPYYYNVPKPRRLPVEWASSVAALFGANRRRKRIGPPTRGGPI